MTSVTVSAARSDTGLVRLGNEDSGYAGHWMYAVADGMGGHAAGEVASAIAIKTIARYDNPEPPERLVPLLGAAVREANDTIRLRTQEDPATRTMGTTLTAMLWSGYAFALAHIGDSRAYRLRDGQLRLLTEDHTLGNLVAGAPSSIASVMSRYLDGRPDRSPDLMIREAVPGDRYLLCSDGLTCILPDSTVRDLLISTNSIGLIADRLIDQANRCGGPDNVTVIAIDIDPGPEEAATPNGLIGAASA